VLPRTMQVSVLRAAGDLSMEERPVPTPAPGEVLVEIASVGVCGSDVHCYRHGRIAEYVVRAPLVLGHEASGRVVAVGEHVDPTRIGERVALEPGVPCRHCRECKAGRYNLCSDVQFFGTPPVDGAFAEYVAIAADFAHPVPDTLSDDAAALIEPLSVAVWACDKAQLTAGSAVLVAGAGPIGLVMVQVARARGATEIVVTDVSTARLAAAQAFGATRTIDAGAHEPAALGVQVDAFIDCSGAEAAVRAGMRAVRPAGRVVLVGMGADEVTLPVGLLQGRELVITGTFRYANTFPAAIALAASGRINLDALVTGRFVLSDVGAALDSDESGGLKRVVVPSRTASA
jgi:L-iditol 2-dehydrogenase